MTYAFFRYIATAELPAVMQEMSRVANGNLLIVEPTLKDLTDTLAELAPMPSKEVSVQTAPALRTSLFFMLYRRFKQDTEFRALIEAETTTTQDHIDVMTRIAGTVEIPLYFLNTSS